MAQERQNYSAGVEFTIVKINGRDHITNGNFNNPTFEEGVEVEEVRGFTTPSDVVVNVLVVDTNFSYPSNEGPVYNEFIGMEQGLLPSGFIGTVKPR